ncbi:MAG: DegQ family serine endoprotease [Alphaproteobacteria bacterium]|nr:DegQ family serine endoprotease [Alphaproteobacteria bacterium]
MERRNLLVVFLTAILGAALGAGLSLTALRQGSIESATRNAPPPALSSPAPEAAKMPALNIPTLAPILKTALPAVVNIAASGSTTVETNPLFNSPFFRHFFGQFGLPAPNQPVTERTQSIGSGVIVDAEKGYVLTNQHMVNNANEIYVILQDGRKIKAKVIGADPETDIAVLQIDANNLTAMPIGDSDTVQVGDFVMAIGNPFGLGDTATFGIVSALGRTGLGIEGYENFIQTDASINPGNSGGALINLQGQMIGINTAILSGGGGNVGIGFAIPIDMAHQVMDQLIAHGKVSHGELGVQIQNVTPELKNALGLDIGTGAIVTKVLKDSPAEQAGIEQGDVIIRLDGKNVISAAELRVMVGLKSIGDKVELGLIRKGEYKTVTATIGKPEVSGEATVEGSDLLKGATFSAIPQDNPAYGKTQGVLVVKVDPDSPAAMAGLQEGDIVLSINQKPVTNLDALTEAAKSRQGSVLLNIQRGDMALFIAIK